MDPLPLRLGPRLMKTPLGPVVSLRGRGGRGGAASRALCFIGRCAGRAWGPGREGGWGSRGGPKSSVIPERLMVASRCFIIFSKCKFVHGVQGRVRGEGRGGGAGPPGRGGPLYKRTFLLLVPFVGWLGRPRRRQGRVHPRATDSAHP